MTDVHIPGTSPVTRATYQNEIGNRNVVLKLMTRNPEASREELEDMFLEKAKGPVDFARHRKNEIMIDHALRYEFTRHYNNIRNQSRARRPALAATITETANAAAMAHVSNIVLLEQIQPNDKKMKDCTAGELRRFGGWKIRIADHIGDDGAIVGEAINESEVQRLLAETPSRRGRGAAR